MEQYADKSLASQDSFVIRSATMAKMSVNEWVKKGGKNGSLVCPVEPQGVTKEKITVVLKKLSRYSDEMRDAIFALLDTSPNWYPTAPSGSHFCDGACIAFIGAHIAILQRQSDAKLDREGRDYWIKPLTDIAAVEPCYLPAKTDTELLKQGNKFYAGHPKAKSPNNAYRLTESFVTILKSKGPNWDALLDSWIKDDAIRQRLSHQAELAEQVKKLTDNSHADLIQACCDFYARKFLPHYEILYIDDSDGDRITDEQRATLKNAGLSIGLHDAIPDVLLWNSKDDTLWVIEAVTSDGEVDESKVKKMVEFAKRHGKKDIGFTTAYPTWRKAAERQKATSNNLALDTYVWIMEDGSKTFKVTGSEVLLDPT